MKLSAYYQSKDECDYVYLAGFNVAMFGRFTVSYSYDYAAQRDVLYLKVPAGHQMTMTDMRATADALFYKSCSCAHACCGHWQVSPYVQKQLSNRVFRIELVAVRNC